MFDSGARSGGIGALEVAAVDAAEAAVGGVGDGELMALVERLEKARRAVEAAMAHVAGELEVRGAVESRTGLRTSNWVAHQFGLPKPYAGGVVGSGVFLCRFEVLDAAFREGRISLDHVRLVRRCTNDRNSDVVEAIQDQLVALAEGVHFDTWRAQVRMLLALADDDGSHEPRPEDNRLGLFDGFDAASLHLDADLVGANAVEVRAALEAEADELFHAYRQDHHATDGAVAIPGRAQLLAEALVALCRKGRANGQDGSAPVSDVSIVFEAPPELGVEDLDEHVNRRRGRSTCCGTHGGTDTAGAVRSWMDGLVARTLDGLPIPADVAELLCCDPLVRAVVMSADGEPLWHGRARRLASKAQRNAAAIRDGGCVFPGCCARPSWCDAHHVAEWDADRGPTDLPNLPLLCRRHHGLVHRKGWGMRAMPGQRFEFITPTGEVLPAQRHGRPPPPRPPAPA